MKISCLRLFLKTELLSCRVKQHFWILIVQMYFVKDKTIISQRAPPQTKSKKVKLKNSVVAFIERWRECKENIWQFRFAKFLRGARAMF